MEQLQLLLDKLHNSAYVFSSIVYHLVAHDNDLKLGFSASVCTEGRYTQCGDGSVAAAAFLLSHSLRKIFKCHCVMILFTGDICQYQFCETIVYD